MFNNWIEKKILLDLLFLCLPFLLDVFWSSLSFFISAKAPQLGKAILLIFSTVQQYKYKQERMSRIEWIFCFVRLGRWHDTCLNPTRCLWSITSGSTHVPKILYNVYLNKFKKSGNHLLLKSIFQKFLWLLCNSVLHETVG